MQSKEIDYGILSDVSRGINYHILGDKSGSTISRRTTKGFKKAFDLSDDDISDQNAEHIVHAAMIGAAGLLFSKKENAFLIGLLLLAVLIFFYQLEG